MSEPEVLFGNCAITQQSHPFHPVGKGIKKTQGIITDLQGGQILPVMPSVLRTVLLAQSRQYVAQQWKEQL